MREQCVEIVDAIVRQARSHTVAEKGER